jgi:hypothetical protein
MTARTSFPPGYSEDGDAAEHGRETAIYQDLLSIRSRFQMWLVENRDRHEFFNDEDQKTAETILEAMESLEDKMNVPL